MSDFQNIIKEIKKAINGKDRAIITSLLAILANGNILIEDIPGVGKTTMAVAFSKALGLEYKRVQFTPDTLPSDITGFTTYDKSSNTLRFTKGAIFCNLFLADELNRTSSRTQSALLEAMEEKQVTVEGKSYKLKSPFSVIATQNPIGASGTQLLPDSQTDRFMVRISMGYPDNNSECRMLLNRSGRNPINDIKQIVTKEQLENMQNQIQDVYLKTEIAQYIVSMIHATRNSPLIARGASPRATLSLTNMAKALAFAEDRDYVIPRDVQNVFVSTIAHRIILSNEALSRRLNEDDVLTNIRTEVKTPRI